MAESEVRFLTNLAALFKLETDYGADSLPTGLANAIQFSNVTHTLAGGEVSRDLLLPYMGHPGVFLTGDHVTLQGSVELAGSGTPGVPPAFGPLLQVCGFSEVITVGEDVQYSTVSRSFKAGTLHYNLDGVRHIGLGGRGTWTLGLSPAQIPQFVFNLTLLEGTITDTPLPQIDLTDFKEPVPVNKANTTMSLFGWDAIAESINIDLSATVVPRFLIGEESIKISGRRSTGTAVVQATDLETINWFEIKKNRTPGVLHIQHGTEAGNIVEIDAPKVQIGRPTQGATDGIANYSLPLMLKPNLGNDELVLTFR
jgi:hypothetical protein